MRKLKIITLQQKFIRVYDKGPLQELANTIENESQSPFRELDRHMSST